MSMELKHCFAVPLPPDRAWGVLLDVRQIARCVPGATVDEVDSDVVNGHIKVKVGPVSLTYRGTAAFTKRDSDARTVVVEASGKETRGAGTASATVRASLEPDSSGTGTLVTMHTTMNLTGSPARFGRGVMVEVSGKLVDQFAVNLAQQIAGGAGLGHLRSAGAGAAPVVPDREQEILGHEPAADVDGFLARIAGSLPAGVQVAGYRLQRQLGQGGMAVVYLARDERLDRLVAVKILAPALVADEAFRRRFIRESRSVAALDDPHIIPVFEAGEAQGVLYIAMRYVPTGDVRTIVRRDGLLPPRRAAAIISQIASALDAAHAAGLVHRDVKPANMLVDVRPNRADHAYLSDFGLSKKTLATSVGLTGTGQFMGTLDYVAPEQIQGKSADGRTDQYGLACSAFELLTGSPPFRREDATAVMYAHLSEPPPLVTSRRAGLPAAVNEVMARALAKAPADRFPSCQEFADALVQALGMIQHDHGPRVVEHPEPDHPPTQIDWPGNRAADQQSTGQPSTITSARPDAVRASTVSLGGTAGESSHFHYDLPPQEAKSTWSARRKARKEQRERLREAEASQATASARLGGQQQLEAAKRRSERRAREIERHSPMSSQEDPECE